MIYDPEEISRKFNEIKFADYLHPIYRELMDRINARIDIGLESIMHYLDWSKMWGPLGLNQASTNGRHLVQ